MCEVSGGDIDLRIDATEVEKDMVLDLTANECDADIYVRTRRDVDVVVENFEFRGGDANIVIDGHSVEAPLHTAPSTKGPCIRVGLLVIGGDVCIRVERV